MIEFKRSYVGTYIYYRITKKNRELQDVTKCNFTKQHVVVNLTRDDFSTSDSASQMR